jgi:hypothetical protein
MKKQVTVNQNLFTFRITLSLEITSLNTHVIVSIVWKERAPGNLLTAVQEMTRHNISLNSE